MITRDMSDNDKKVNLERKRRRELIEKLIEMEKVKVPSGIDPLFYVLILAVVLLSILMIL